MIIITIMMIIRTIIVIIRTIKMIIRTIMMIISIFIKVGASKWEEDDTMMLLPMLFAWHLIANLLIQVKTFNESNDKEKISSSSYMKTTLLIIRPLGRLALSDPVEKCGREAGRWLFQVGYLKLISPFIISRPQAAFGGALWFWGRIGSPQLVVEKQLPAQSLLLTSHRLRNISQNVFFINCQAGKVDCRVLKWYYLH